MKKKVSILLAVITLCTMTLCVSGFVSAADECTCYDGISECKCFENGMECECTYRETYGHTKNGFEIYFYDPQPCVHADSLVLLKIGGYIYYDGWWISGDLYNYGVYAKKDSIDLPIKDAYNAGYLDADELASIIMPKRHETVGRLGDANSDGAVNMRDVLLMQKKVAKVETSGTYNELFATGYGRPLDMKHVLTAQKIAAYLEVDYEKVYK